MKTILLSAVVAGLVLASASSAEAVIMGTESKHCGCSLVEVPPDPPAYQPDLTGGWGAFVGTAEEKAAAQLADLLHEPEPEPSRWVEVCIDPPRPGRPGVPGAPGVPDVTGPDWRPFHPPYIIEITLPDPRVLPDPHRHTRTVPEPASLALFGLAALAVAPRLRRRVCR